ncbi:MAG: phosphoadenosine phosphosulfate reductase family protein [Candidatus Cloacimonetes bacterium]|nr:phosphoadenosine phosphosulfate reductase family protein [Candidatus Cloacimonadota bacterium]
MVNDNIILWDKEHSSPKILTDNLSDKQKYSYLSTDARPIFIEEKYLMTLLFPNIDDSIFSKTVWADKSNNYNINGTKLNGSIYDYFRKTDLSYLRSKVKTFQPTNDMIAKEKEIFNSFVSNNKERLDYILTNKNKDNEGYSIGAEPFINEVIHKYDKRLVNVSFSGGKDSIAVSNLVRRTTVTNDIVHFFANTTIEDPLNYNFIKQFQENNSNVLLLEFKNENQNFFDLAEKIGPPSRRKSWCCSIFKTGPIGSYYSGIKENLLTFYGIRRSESTSRSKYNRVVQSPKLKKQIVASPIIDWKDIDVWLYLFSINAQINPAYRFGYSRVGCWCCPNNSNWSDILNALYIPDKFDNWSDQLIEFAKKIGKPDPEEYTYQGFWKARAGGEGLTKAKEVKFKVKQEDERSRTYFLTKELDISFYEYFKPFGQIGIRNDEIQNGLVNIIDKKTKESIIRIEARLGEKVVNIKILKDLLNRYLISENKNKVINHNIFNYIEKQIRKFQVCINCKACTGTCPVSAIKVLEKNKLPYYIYEYKCINCLKCVDHFPKGCLIASALDTKKVENEL